MADLILENDDVVQNIQEKHAKPPKGFSSWKNYWCHYSDEEWPKTCRFRFCGDTADGSAHVNVNGDMDSVYIIPMCQSHHRPEFKDPFNVNSGTYAVYTDKDYTTQEIEKLARQIDQLGVSNKVSLKRGTKVRNIPRTSRCQPRGYGKGSWKKYYINDGERKWPSTCRVSYCTNDADGGAHVEVHGKNGVFIVPMCTQLHNTPQNDEWMDVKKDTIAVRVKKEDTKGPAGICHCN